MMIFLFVTKMVANVTDCDSSSTEALVQCLRQKNEEELINVMKKVSCRKLPSKEICNKLEGSLGWGRPPPNAPFHNVTEGEQIPVSDP